MNPIISVCIPTYKRNKFLMKAIDSVVSNNYKNFEIIVSDDADDKKLKKMIQALKDPRIRYYAHKKSTIEENWSHAVERANGKYVFKLDDDDYIMPDFLEKTVRFLNKNKNVGIVFTGFEKIRPNQNNAVRVDEVFFKNRNIVSGFEYAQAIMLNKNYPINHKSAGVFRKSLIKKMDYFRVLTVDVMFTVGIASLSDVGYIPEPLFIYVGHAGNNEGMGWRPLEMTLNCMDKLFDFKWIKKNPEWMQIKKEALGKMRLVIPLGYLFAQKKSNGYQTARNIFKKIKENFPKVMENKMFPLLANIILILPSFLYAFVVKLFFKGKFLRKLINLFAKK